MKTEHLQYLLEIIECNSFNKASKTLHINNQHLARIINSLEDEIGVKILERNHKGVEITPEGQLVVEYAKDVVEKTNFLLNNFRHNDIKSELTIYITATINSRLFPLIQSFSQQYPNVNFNIKEQPISTILKELSAHQHSVAIISLYPNIPELNPLFPEDLQFEVLYTGKYLAIASPTNTFITHQKSTSLKSLLKQDLVVYAPYTSTLPKLLTKAGSPNIKYKIDNINTFYEFLDTGECISIIFDLVFTEQLAKRYVTLPLRDNIQVEAGILTHKNILKDPLIQDFISHMRHFLHLG